MGGIRPYDLLCITTAERNLIVSIINDLIGTSDLLSDDRLRFLTQDDVKCTFERLIFLSGRLDKAVNAIWQAKEHGELLEQD